MQTIESQGTLTAKLDIQSLNYVLKYCKSFSIIKMCIKLRTILYLM